jgi:hypothetical protein
MRWIALAAILGITIVGCGGGSASVAPVGNGPSVEEIASCLQKGGATVNKVLEEQEGAFDMVFAGTQEASISIANLARPDLDRWMTKFMEKTKASSGIGGKLVTTLVNGGWTVVGLVAAPGKEDAASERLAKSCAVRTPTA